MQRKTAYLLGLLALAGIAVWYFFVRGKVADVQIANTGTGLGSADTDAYNKMVALFKAECDPGALNWLLPKVKDILDGKKQTHIDYLVAGKVSKAGAFIGVYATDYYSWGYKIGGQTPGNADASMRSVWKAGQGGGNDPRTPYTIAREGFNDRIYAIFQAFAGSEVSDSILNYTT